MFRKKKKIYYPNTPENRFRLKFAEESYKSPGMTVKIERIPQGIMKGTGKNHKVKYIHASKFITLEIEEQILEWFGSGTYVLKFVDEAGQPLNEYGAMWFSQATQDEEPDVRMQAAECDLMEASEEYLFLSCLKARKEQRWKGEFAASVLQYALEKRNEESSMEYVKQLGLALSSMREQQSAQRREALKRKMDELIQTLLDQIAAQTPADYYIHEEEPGQPSQLSQPKSRPDVPAGVNGMMSKLIPYIFMRKLPKTGKVKSPASRQDHDKGGDGNGSENNE